MEVIGKYMIDSSVELVPSFRISPFSTFDVSTNAMLDNSHIETASSYLSTRFKNYTLTANGRSAIAMALAYYKLQPNDTVTILTTTGNFYISGCVTKEIEKVCRWSRGIEPSTKVIFVNHEFGYPYQRLAELKKYGLPIIEDCAHTFYSIDLTGEMGTVGDFVIYSLPKAFPIQGGGILSNNLGLSIEPNLNSDFESYILRIVGAQVSKLDENISRRVNNYSYLRDNFLSIGLRPFFDFKSSVVPGVFMFGTPRNLDLPRLKQYTQSNGIESSVFYGKEAFFIPCHQNLSPVEMDYFYEVIKNFIQ